VDSGKNENTQLLESVQPVQLVPHSPTRCLWLRQIAITVAGKLCLLNPMDNH